MSRYSYADIVFDGADITKDVQPYFLSLTYTDNEDGETDDLQLKFQDRSQIWLQKWLKDALNAAVSSQTVETQQTAATTATATVTAPSGLRLRAGPSTSTARLTCAPYGSKVTVTDHSGKWWACSYGGQNGYMWSSWLKLDEEQEQQTQVVAKQSFKIQATLHRCNWHAPGTDETLDTGEFELDAVTASGPPSVITIKGTSLPYSSPIRQTKKTKAWESYKLSGIANEMAGQAGMAVMYLSDYDPDIAREEQTEESDIEFISRVAHGYGLSVKVTNKAIVIFDQLTYEKMASVMTITRGDGSYAKYKLATGSADTKYDACHVSYTDPSGQVIEATVKTSDYDAEAKAKEEEAAKKAAESAAKSAGKTQTAKQQETAAKKAAEEAKKKVAQTLEIHQKVSSVAEAKVLAEKMLRMHNKFSRTASFTLEGNPKLCAGSNVDLAGFGPWDGKYCISSSKHTISTSGYVTTITLRNTLENY